MQVSEDKVVHAYPIERYERWQCELPNIAFSCGKFGENFTTRGLFEGIVNISDCFHLGSAEVIATQPRMSCYN